LSARVQESERVAVFEKTRVLDLVVERGRCWVRAERRGPGGGDHRGRDRARHWGCGQVYRYTTNPVVATGDGFAIAHRAGVKLADMEFVQFHPTALDTPENPLALVSEAVRGEGATLLNADGERFMVERHRLAELRRATWSRVRSSGSRPAVEGSISMHESSGPDSGNDSRASTRYARRAASIRHDSSFP
jgi:L-aspartate oxidase